MEGDSMNRFWLAGKWHEPILTQIFPEGSDGYYLAMERKPRRLLSQNLRRLMDANNLSTHALKRLSGIPQTTIARILREESAPTLDQLQPLAKAFKLPVWSLMYPDLDPAFPPKLQEGPIHSIPKDRLQALLTAFDSLTEHQQATALRELWEQAEANLNLVRDLRDKPDLRVEPRAQEAMKRLGLTPDQITTASAPAISRPQEAKIESEATLAPARKVKAQAQVHKLPKKRA